MGIADVLNKPIGASKGDETKSAGKKSGGKKGRKPNVRNLPVKRTINLATTGEKPINLAVALPSILAIILVAAVLSKFFVVDRLMQVSRATAQVAALQSQLDEAYVRLNSFGEISEEYAHYTYSGMTREEMERTDRVAILELIQRAILPQAWVTSWSVSSNLMTLDITRGNLQEINLLVQQLNEEPLVDFCTVTTAATTNTVSGAAVSNQGDVSGQIVVYLKSVPDAEPTTEAPTEEAKDQSMGAALDKALNTVDALDQAARQTETTVAEEVGP